MSRAFIEVGNHSTGIVFTPLIVEINTNIGRRGRSRVIGALEADRLLEAGNVFEVPAELIPSDALEKAYVVISVSEPTWKRLHDRDFPHLGKPLGDCTVFVQPATEVPSMARILGRRLFLCSDLAIGLYDWASLQELCNDLACIFPANYNPSIQLTKETQLGRFRTLLREGLVRHMQGPESGAGSFDMFFARFVAPEVYGHETPETRKARYLPWLQWTKALMEGVEEDLSSLCTEHRAT